MYKKFLKFRKASRDKFLDENVKHCGDISAFIFGVELCPKNEQGTEFQAIFWSGGVENNDDPVDVKEYCEVYTEDTTVEEYIELVNNVVNNPMLFNNNFKNFGSTTSNGKNWCSGDGAKYFIELIEEYYDEGKKAWIAGNLGVGFAVKESFPYVKFFES